SCRIGGEYTLPHTSRFAVIWETPVLTHCLALRMLLLSVLAGPALAAEMEWVRLSNDKKGFVLDKSCTRFIPWGFNYDHDDGGRLLEDYWDSEWSAVEKHFAQMKDL